METEQDTSQNEIGDGHFAKGYFEMMLPKKQPSGKKKHPQIKAKNKIKETIKLCDKPASTLNQTTSVCFEIFETIKQKLQENRLSIERKKLINIIKKRMLPFFLEEDAFENIKIVFLQINNNLKDCLKRLNELFKEELDNEHISNYEITDADQIYKIKKSIIMESNNKICFYFSEIFENQTKLKDSLKLFNEEICSLEKFKKQNFLFVLQISSNLSFDNIKSFAKSKVIEFYETEHLMANFYFEILKDINFYPLIDFSCLRSIFDEFDSYNCSFCESVEKLKKIILIYLCSNDFDEKKMGLLRSFLLNDDTLLNSKDNLLSLKVNLGQLRTRITGALSILEEIFFNIIGKKKKRKIAILNHLIKKKEFSFPEKIKSLEPEQLGFQISELMTHSKNNFGGQYSKFSLKFTKFDNRPPKIPSKNDKRFKQLMKDLDLKNITEKDKFIYLEEKIEEFMNEYIIGSFRLIENDFGEFLISDENNKTFNDFVNPDILGNIAEAFSEEKNGKFKNKSRVLFKIIQKFGKKFDINSAYASFIKEIDEKKLEEKELNARFFYSLNELKFLGLINPQQKSSLVFQKNIFGKTFVHDYSQKMKNKN